MKSWRYEPIFWMLIISAFSLQACALPNTYKPSGEGRFPAVIVVHSRGSIREHLPEFAFDLSRKGYVTVAVDYRDFGDIHSMARASPRFLRNALLKSRAYDAEDLRKAYDLLKTLPEVDPNRIGMVVFSWGALYGRSFMSKSPDRKIRGIVNYNAGSLGSWRDSAWLVERANYPPALFLAGELYMDEIATTEELVDFCKMQRQMHKICEVHNYGSKGIHPALKDDPVNYPGGIDRAFTADAFNRAVAFLDKYVKGK